MYLRRLFRTKCEEQNRHNPFNSDIDFKFLPLRSKVEALHALCDFRLEAEDVLDLIKHINPDKLRVDPLGYDKNGSSYWYFYGTRLYREDHPKSKPKKQKSQSTVNSIWQVVCFTEKDWVNLVQKFEDSKHNSDVLLYNILVEQFLPELPKWFKLKENLQRTRALSSKPRRISNTESDCEQIVYNNIIDNRRKNCLKMSSSKNKITTGRQTNNSLASATGQILIQSNKNRAAVVQTVDKDISAHLHRYCQTDEDLQTGMYKILEHLKSHDDAWPFIDPVEEEYAPNYYTIIRRPMDLQRMEDKLDAGKYSKFSEFKADFQLLVNNCKLYNGQDNEYTEMVDNLQQAFVKATNRFLDQSSSDEETDFPIIPIPPAPTRGRPKLKENAAKEKPAKVSSKTSSKPSKIEVASPTSKKRKRSPDDSPKSKKKKIVKETKEVKHSSKLKKKNKKLKRVKSDVSKPKYESFDEKESDIEEKHIKEEPSPPKSKSKKEKSVLPEEKTPKSSKKSKKNKTRGVGRPSKKKNKNKKKHSKNSDESKPKEKKTASIKEKIADVDSEDGISSRSRSPSPLLSYSEESDSEKFKIDYKDNKDNNKESINKHPKHKWKDSSMDTEDKFDKMIGMDKDKSNTPNKSKTVHSDKNSVLNDKSEKDKKKNLSAKEKNLMLSDTIEKLRAKNKKSKENSMRFDEIFGKPKDKKVEETPPNDEYEFVDDSVSKKSSNNKKTNSKTKKKVPNNDTSMDALDAETEQTLKDMDKWFTESEIQNTSQDKTKTKTNPADTVPGFKKPDKDVKTVDKSCVKKDGKDVVKRKFLRDSLKQLFNKKREMQRTIDRLQPGKTKGNLINTVSAQPVTKVPVVESTSPTLKTKETKEESLQEVSDTCPKLSLGTVLPTEGFGLVQQHNFNDEGRKQKKTSPEKSEKSEKEDNTQVNEITSLRSSEEDEIFERPFKACQEKATPNLSAWFKAFGAPKGPKKKTEEPEESQPAPTPVVPEPSTVLPPPPQQEKPVVVKAVEVEPDCPITSAESPESNRTPRTRRTSTGSTVSDHSNFSQDMDSPRTGIDERMSSTYPLSYPSPKITAAPQKPSPKTEDVQKSINVGFYQDMTKSSPEKSCSPQEPNRPQGTLPTSASHLYPSQNSPNPLQSFTNPYSGLMNYDRESLPYYDYKASSMVPENNADYVSLSPNNSSTKSFGQPNSPYGPQSGGPYNKHMPNNQQVMLGPNSPFSYSSQSSPYSNSDLSSPYGTPQPNSPYSQQTSSPNPNQQAPAPSSYPMKKRGFNDGKLSPTNNTKIGITQEVKQKETPASDVENVSKTSVLMQSSPSGELINMGYSKPDDKPPQSIEDKPTIFRDDKQQPFALDKAKKIDFDDNLKSRTGDEFTKNFSKPLTNKPTYLFDMPTNMGFPHSIIPSTNYPPQNIPERPAEVLNMNYANVQNQKTLPKQDDMEAINYKQKHLQATNKVVENLHKVQPVFPEAYGKALPRPGLEISEPTRKSAVVLNSAPDTKLQMPTNDFMSYSSRNLNIPGINLNIPQCNTNIHLLNSIPNMDNRVPPNAHIGLPLNQPPMHARTYDLHNTNNSLANQNYKFSANSPNMLDPSLRKLTNMPQGIRHFMENSSPNYYEASKATQQLQPQNAHAATMSTMQTMLQHSQTMSMAYNRQQAMNSQCSVISDNAKPVVQTETKRKSSKKKTAVSGEPGDLVSTQQQGFQTYASVKTGTGVVKPDGMKQTKNPLGSAFNFGPGQPGLNLTPGLYNTNESYLDNSNPYYLPHRSSSSDQDKPVNPSVSQFQYLSSPAARTGDYPYIGTPSGSHLVDSSAPIYQQYLQSQDLLRQQTNAQMMLNQGLISNPAAAYASPRYHAALGMRQTYDPMNPRPPWL
ncbi:bromodomain-containing protein 4-like isoform X2 [Ctenocephalides felis]|nr:bromodomain-containing protein 4-like isoform X2 [Ctenocephalides felis]